MGDAPERPCTATAPPNTNFYWRFSLVSRTVAVVIYVNPTPLAGRPDDLAPRTGQCGGTVVRAHRTFRRM